MDEHVEMQRFVEKDILDPTNTFIFDFWRVFAGSKTSLLPVRKAARMGRGCRYRRRLCGFDPVLVRWGQSQAGAAGFGN